MLFCNNMNIGLIIFVVAILGLLYFIGLYIYSKNSYIPVPQNPSFDGTVSITNGLSNPVNLSLPSKQYLTIQPNQTMNIYMRKNDKLETTINHHKYHFRWRTPTINRLLLTRQGFEKIN